MLPRLCKPKFIGSFVKSFTKSLSRYPTWLLDFE